MRCVYLTAAVSALFAAPAYAEAPAPDIARALLDAAAETNDQREIAAVSRALARTFPDTANSIDAYAQSLIDALATQERTAEASLHDSAAKDGSGASEETPPDGFWRLGAWEGVIDAGATLASGNSDNIAAGVSVDASLTRGKLTHNVTAGIDIGAAAAPASAANPDPDRELTQKRWYGAYKLDIAFSERSYAFARVSYEEDQFSGFDYRIFGGAGLGRFLYKSQPFTWLIEGGPGYRFSPIDDTRETESEFAAYASSKIDWVIRDGLLYEQNNDATWTASTSTFTSLTALTTSITNDISTGLSVNIRYETNPPLGRENLDTLVKASLKYGF